ncbi:phytanoyl-CoA dioxygenase family protein [Polynucleobacter sp. JS-Mosq-20-D10]|uniref:phytanoyl-CoA dioxygenase family protein n=1 Tax=Polynucleobacter sp. JS-Mosq-20-D10 TaxID=2576922 RepID=UPI001BFD24AD|nr:phytanoyl-CoA dioxygenase family protein [Polynucleobacter sp. JS-Mosq-20-D10]QWE01318.1 phytanoyl-CoA dioxygenase family protein [Polynucleobacter sp. JS-Mosq-20-D10]
MPKFLTEAQVQQFKDLGYVSNLRVMDSKQTQAIRDLLEDFEKRQGSPLHGSQRHKTHLLFPWLNELVRETKIVDAIEDLYGHNILCWTSNFFIKEAHDPGFVSWHQDSTYWGLSSPDVVTAWIALSPSNKSNGAMAVIPGTHSMEQIPHRDTYSKNNLLTRGQEVAVEVDEGRGVTLELEPGEMSLHHVRIIHGSPPNNSDARRIGFAIRYIPTYVKQIEGDDSATLVRGEDEFKTFAHEPRPSQEMEPAFVKLHQEITDKSAKILYKGTKVDSYDASLADPKVRSA